MVLILWSSYKFHVVLHKVPLKRLLMLDSDPSALSLTHTPPTATIQARKAEKSPSRKRNGILPAWVYVTWRPHAAVETVKCTPNASWNEWHQRQGHSLLPEGREAPPRIPKRLLDGQQSGSGRVSAAPSLLGDDDNDGNSACEHHPVTTRAQHGLVLLAFS